jgi:hypothetical protein
MEPGREAQDVEWARPGDQHASHLCRPRQGHWRLASRLFLRQATGGRSDSPSSRIPGSPPRLKAFQNGSWSRSRVTLPQWRGHVSVCLMLPVMLKPTTTLREQQELAQVQGLPVLWSPSSFLSTAGNLSSETIARAIPQPARTRRGSCLPPAPEKERPFIPVLKRTGLSGPFSVIVIVQDNFFVR